MKFMVQLAIVGGSIKMSYTQLNDLFCKCDNKEGMGELNIKTGEYICLRCNSVLNKIKKGCCGDESTHLEN